MANDTMQIVNDGSDQKTRLHSDQSPRKTDLCIQDLLTWQDEDLPLHVVNLQTA
jgi:hypothetical protein